MSNTTKETIWMVLTMVAVAVILASTYQWTPWEMGRRITALETRISALERPSAVKVRSLKQMDRDLRAQGTATVEANRRAERAERLVKGRVWERRVIPSVSPWVVYRGGLER